MGCLRTMKRIKRIKRLDTLRLICILFLAMCFFGNATQAQYEESPLKGKKWFTISAGANSMDQLAWQGMATFSSRGESVLTQTRLAYSQELFKADNDSCAEHKNRLAEVGLLWGDGWAGKRWYATASIGFGFNVRMFCRYSAYNNQYITAVTLGLPFQVEAGFFISKNLGINVVGVGNWNFRAPYGGGHLGVFYRFNKPK